MQDFNKTYQVEMDENVATERILNRMTDPRYIEQRRRQKEEAKRVETIRNKHTL